MFRLAVKYFHYKLFSGHRKGHGIHSPFVYSLIRSVLINRTRDDELNKILRWHSKISNSILPEQKSSFGSGSQIFKIFGRKKIRASRIGISRKYGVMLYHLVRFISPARIIELGTGSGISSAYLTASDPEIQVITIEGSKERLEFAKNNLSKLNIQNIEFIEGDFDEVLKKIKIGEDPILVFIDGNHSYEASMRYFRHFSSKSGENSVLVFDDIRWSVQMEKAWAEIKSDSKVTISIDLFFTGLVFFRPGVTKQDFIVNF